MVEYNVRYIAGDYLCVVVLIKMILEQEGYISKVIDRIATIIPVSIPSGYDVSACSDHNYHIADDNSRWGVEISDSMFNMIFSMNSIKLTCSYVDIHRYLDYEFGDFLHSMVSHGYHVMLGVDYGLMINDASRQGYKHACLLQDIEQDNVILYNPGPHMAGDLKVDLGDLYRAIHLGKGGVWIFHKTIID